MMSLKDIPIRRKLIAIMLLITAIAMLLTGVSFFVYQFLCFREATVQQLSTVGKVIAANSTAALAFDNQNDAQETLAALQADSHITAGGLYDRSGKLFAKFPPNAKTALFPKNLEGVGYRYEGPFLLGFQPVVQGDRNLGTLYLQLDTGTILRQWLLDSIAIAVLVMTAALGVAYLLSRILQRQISQPIVALAETAKAISGHRDFSVRARRFSDDELGLLTDAFNQMLGEIQAQNEAIRRDIAARKAAQEEVRLLNVELEERVQRRTVDLETANKELEAFSYSVSHDLRAPVRAMNGFSQAVLEDYGASLPEEARRYVKIIHAGAKRMGDLIDDLLAFSRLSRTALRKQAVDTTKLVNEVVEELNGERNGRQIDIHVADLPACQGDRALLKQVWVNLISNGVKYTKNKPKAIVEVGSQRENNENIYFVKDNGTGFSMKYADKLFGVFQRLHREEEFEGTGVGLAIVQRIVHRHGGRVWAQAQVDQGAAFYFTLGDPCND